MTTLKSHLLIGIFFLTSFSGFNAQKNSKSCTLINSVKERLNALHVQAIQLGDKEKREIISLYIKRIDESNLFFTKENVETIQNSTEKGLCEAFQLSIKIYESSLKYYDSLLKKYLSSPIRFVKDEKIVFNTSENEHLRSKQKEYDLHLQKYLKYQILSMSYDKFSEDSLLIKTFTSALDVELRKKLLENETEFVNRMLAENNDIEEQLREDFLNAISLRYDPHSSFFSPEDKVEMEEELSSERSVFGVEYFENKDFEIEIVSIAPGSAAWNSNSVFEGDIIVEIEDNKGKKHQLKNKGVKFISKILSQTDKDETVFYIRNKSGVTNKVKLIKTVIENIENSFTGYLLSDSLNKIGYISLPSFYTDFESDYQLGCANDVAKEILLLKKDSIKGLILDLRNNGGGSLKEAIELSGLFIDEGPMSVYKGKIEKPYLLKDMNRGTVYDGPLVVLVNSMSASASEFFAGCMQDYGRGLIVGDRTYGKGTAQSVFPLDTLNLNVDDGFVKVTTGKFYHVSSRSNQALGIVPDVLVEDMFSGLDYYLESNQAHYLHNDSTIKKVIFNKCKPSFDQQIIEKSKSRILASNELKELKKKSLDLKNKVELDQIIPLEFASFLKYSDDEKLFWEKLHKQEEIKSPFKITNHSFAEKMFSYQEAEKEFNNELMLKLKKDLLIHESFLLFKDLFIFAK